MPTARQQCWYVHHSLLWLPRSGSHDPGPLLAAAYVGEDDTPKSPYIRPAAFQRVQHVGGEAVHMRILTCA